MINNIDNFYSDFEKNLKYKMLVRYQKTLCWKGEKVLNRYWYIILIKQKF